MIMTKNLNSPKRLLVVLPTFFSVCLVLTSCGSDASAKFVEAGCASVSGWKYSAAAQQFDLAAQNGDPEAVTAAENARTLARYLNSASFLTLEQITSSADYINGIESDLKEYCSIS